MSKMIMKRIIPMFLLHGNRLVKGTKFKWDDVDVHFEDVGDPVSQAMICRDQDADEIMIVDIDASKQNRLIDIKLIEKINDQCNMSISVGGGIKSFEDAKKIINSGSKKVILNTYAGFYEERYKMPLISLISKQFGSQSVVVSIDVKMNAIGNYDVYTFSGSKKKDVNFCDYLSTMVDYGAGEVVITDINREGTLSGFNNALYSECKKIISIPIIACGGAGCYDDIVSLFRETDCEACSVGKMFFLRDYDIIRIKSYLKDKRIHVRDA